MEVFSGLHIILLGGNHIIYRFFHWLMLLRYIRGRKNLSLHFVAAFFFVFSFLFLFEFTERKI